MQSGSDVCPSFCLSFCVCDKPRLLTSQVMKLQERVRKDSSAATLYKKDNAPAARPYWQTQTLRWLPVDLRLVLIFVSWFSFQHFSFAPRE